MDSKIKPPLIRIRDINNDLISIQHKLNTPNISYGMRNSLLKSVQLKKSQLKSLMKRISNLTEGNIITITFQVEPSKERYRKIYTNLSKEDAKLHLRMMSSLQDLEITILEIKEVFTKDSLIKL